MNIYKYILRWNGVEKILDVAPAGWDTWTRRYFRHSTHGVLMSDATSQRFVFTGGYFDYGGGYFIKEAFETEGVKAIIEFERQKRNPFTDVYYTDYIGIIDMSPEGGYKEEEDEWIEVMTVDSGKLQDFISNFKTEYDLNSLIATNGNSITPFTDSPKQCTYQDKDVYLDALSDGEISVVRTNYPAVLSSGTEPYDATYEFNRMGDRIITGEEKIYENTKGETVDWNFFLDAALNYTTTYKPVVSPAPGWYAEVTIRVYLRIYDSGDNPIHSELINSKIDRVDEPEENVTNTITDTIDYNLQYDLPDGYYVVFRMEWDVDGSDVVLDFDWTVTVAENLIYEKNFIQGVVAPAYLTHETATRLMQLNTGETDTSKLIDAPIFGRTDSEFKTYDSDGRLAYLATTSGKALRKYPDYTIKVSFEKWFQSIDKMGNIALYYDKINDIFRFVDKADVYKNEEMFELTSVDRVTTILHAESYFSTVKGCNTEKGDYEQASGAAEYNVISEYTVDMPSVDALDLQAPYNTDTLSAAFAMEQEWFFSGGEDTKYDDKIMIIEMDGTLKTIRNSDLGTYTGYLGVDDGWNGNYTPRKCILQNGNWVGACFYRTPDGVIQFTGNAKDTIITYDGVSENDDITVTDLGEPLYWPEVDEVEAPITTEMINELDVDPHRYISYPKDGEMRQGFIIDSEINEYQKKGKFTLLLNNPNR